MNNFEIISIIFIIISLLGVLGFTLFAFKPQIFKVSFKRIRKNEFQVLRIIKRKKIRKSKEKFLFKDLMTGALSRTYFEKKIDDKFLQSNYPTSILMVDIDGFKLINDTFGHEQGNKYLKKTADLLRKNISKEDKLIRYGGDEFMILLPKTSKEETIKLIQKIKKQFQGTKSTDMPINISIGYSTSKSIPVNEEELTRDSHREMIKNKISKKDKIEKNIIRDLGRKLTKAQGETFEHRIKLKNLALELGEAINLAPKELDTLSIATLIHDIGHLRLSEKRTNKKEILTKEEWDILKRVPELGYDIAKNNPQIEITADHILTQFENWDGSGYPLGLKGENIPISSRIFSIIKTYDSLTQSKPYRKGISRKEIINELKKESGTKLDPDLVNEFVKILHESI